MQVKHQLELAVLLALAGGCAAVAAGAAAGAATYGAIKYTENEVFADFKVSLDRAWLATVDSLRDEGLQVPADATHSATDGEIELKDADPTVWARVEAHPQGFTRVRLRVGTFETEENKRRSELLLRRIERRLK